MKHLFLNTWSESIHSWDCTAHAKLTLWNFFLNRNPLMLKCWCGWLWKDIIHTIIVIYSSMETCIDDVCVLAFIVYKFVQLSYLLQHHCSGSACCCAPVHAHSHANANIYSTHPMGVRNFCLAQGCSYTSNSRCSHNTVVAVVQHAGHTQQKQ